MTANKETPFSAREMEVLALAWQCMETQPKIDMAKLAHLTGYTPGSASVTLGKIKQKIKHLGDSLSAHAPATPKKPSASAAKSTPASAAKKRGAARADGGHGSPSKKARTIQAKTKGMCGDGDGHADDDGDEEFVALKIKKEEVRGLGLKEEFWAEAKQCAGVVGEEMG